MIKLASVMLLTPPRTDVCVWCTEAWMLLSVTQSQKCLSYCPCVCLPSSPLSPCTADQIKWTVHQSLSLLIIPAVCFHLSPPLKYGHGSSILLFSDSNLTVVVSVTVGNLCSFRSCEVQSGKSAEVWRPGARMGQQQSVPEDLDQAAEVLSTISGRGSVQYLS